MQGNLIHTDVASADLTCRLPRRWRLAQTVCFRDLLVVSTSVAAQRRDRNNHRTDPSPT